MQVWSFFQSETSINNEEQRITHSAFACLKLTVKTKVRITFKVNNKDIRARAKLMASFWCLYC